MGMPNSHLLPTRQLMYEHSSSIRSILPFPQLIVVK